jgi:two-component system, sensor histidine kinase and response regulator
MSKATVLIVEDDVNLLAGIRDILKLDGYDVLTAENGEQGVKIMQTHPTPPDLIVSDIMMPRMDGITFFKEVRKERRWLEIPFIFLTAKGEKIDYQRGMRLGADDYVIKPYDPGDLLVKIESRLERLRALRRANLEAMGQLKTQILTILNHEFRTPLTFVVAYADMLNNAGELKLKPEEIVSFLQGVSAGADRLRSLIENFILLVEIETGEVVNTYNWRKRPVDSLQDLFRAAAEKTKNYDKMAGRELVGDVPTDIPPFVADPEFLMICLYHLIQNAAKFSPEGLPIHYGAAQVEGDVQLWVQDGGRGIPEAELENIWQTFYQINRQENEDQGAGAGLAIVRGLVELHGGYVEVESTVGAGSTFRMVIPIVAPPPPASSNGSSA